MVQTFFCRNKVFFFYITHPFCNLNGSISRMNDSPGFFHHYKIEIDASKSFFNDSKNQMNGPKCVVKASTSVIEALKCSKKASCRKRRSLFYYLSRSCVNLNGSLSYRNDPFGIFHDNKSILNDQKRTLATSIIK